MYAILKHGGKQYRLENGAELALDKINAEVGARIDLAKLGKLLLLADGAKVTLDRKELEKTPLAATVIEQYKDDKVIVFNYQSKKGLRRKKGHRQPLTRVRIDAIGSAPEKVAAPTKAAAPKKETASKKEALPKKVAAPKKETAAKEPATAKQAVVKKAAESKAVKQEAPKKASGTAGAAAAKAKKETAAKKPASKAKSAPKEKPGKEK